MRTLAGCLLVCALAGRAAAAPRIGDRAPALELRALDGAVVSLGGGQVVVIDFFATWCQPCREAMAALDQATRPYGGRVKLVIVDAGEERAAVERFFADHPPPAGAVVALDPDLGASRRWGRDRLPTTFFVDGDGVVRHINRGFGSGYAQRVANWLRAMLGPRH